MCYLHAAAAGEMSAQQRAHPEGQEGTPRGHFGDTKTRQGHKGGTAALGSQSDHPQVPPPHRDVMSPKRGGDVVGTPKGHVGTPKGTRGDPKRVAAARPHQRQHSAAVPMAGGHRGHPHLRDLQGCSSAPQKSQNPVGHRPGMFVPLSSRSTGWEIPPKSLSLQGLVFLGLRIIWF